MTGDIEGKHREQDEKEHSPLPRLARRDQWIRDGQPCTYFLPGSCPWAYQSRLLWWLRLHGGRNFQPFQEDGQHDEVEEEIHPLGREIILANPVCQVEEPEAQPDHAAIGRG